MINCRLIEILFTSNLRENLWVKHNNKLFVMTHEVSIYYIKSESSRVFLECGEFRYMLMCHNIWEKILDILLSLTERIQKFKGQNASTQMLRVESK